MKLSRTKLELLMDCPRCFYLDLVHKIKRPSGPPFTLNLAIDTLLKAEFDVHRAQQTRHPVMEKFKINAVPYQSENMRGWRVNSKGIQFLHPKTDLLVCGAVDDIWQDLAEDATERLLHVVDYKATGAKAYNIYASYKRQMEIYMWLLIQNGFHVSPTGYFLFAKANKAEGFEGAALSFDMFIEPQAGDTSWVEEKVLLAKRVLDSNKIPDASSECEHCEYRGSAEKLISSLREPASLVPQG
jgi:hypothetical protein